jgi:hypothetical protein
MKRSNLFILFISVLFFVSVSCKKEGIGGKSSISGYVNHHGLRIPNAVVYIKYGATEFPGTDLAKYDDKTTSDASAYYEIKNLRRGNYYLYSLGFDNSINEVVSGGVAVKLLYNKSADTDIPVTE